MAKVDYFEPGDQDFNQFPVCPYCGECNEDCCDLPLDSDGDISLIAITDIECENCGKEFTVIMCVRVEYSTSKKE